MATKRAPAGCTFEPCHGCGKAPNEYTGRPKDGVCAECRTALDKWAQLQKEQAAKSDERVYFTKERAYALPYLPEEVERKGRREAIREPLLRLHMLVSRPAPEGEHWKDLREREESGDAFTYAAVGWRDNDFRIIRLFPVAVADALRELYAGIHDSLKAAHAKGHAEGRSLLLGLASGRITNDQFNEAAARLDPKSATEGEHQ